MKATVRIELAKLTLPTDKIKNVETITNNNYSVNERFEVTRKGKVYFVSIKEVNVMGSMKKHHVRLEVDTDLPKIIIKVDNSEKISSLQQKIDKLKIKMKLYEKNEKYKNLSEWYSANLEKERLEARISKLK